MDSGERQTRPDAGRLAVDQLGDDLESRVPNSGRLRFIEVKGRDAGAVTVTVTRNEILYSPNKREDFILAIVESLADNGHRVRYVRQPFNREPDFDVTSVNYDLDTLLGRVRRSRGDESLGRWPGSAGRQRALGACDGELARKKKRPLRGVGPAMLSLAG